MPAEQVPASIGVVREAVRQKVLRTSLRAVAEEIDLSHSGLFSFLDGGEPYQKTRLKLLAWYANEEERTMRVELSSSDADAMLTTLVQHLPPNEWENAKATLRSIIVELSAGHPPSWLADRQLDMTKRRRSVSST